MSGRPAPTLFDAAQLAETRCPACGAIRFPQQPRAITCAHDLDPERRRRPRGCLNTYRPEHAEVPY